MGFTPEGAGRFDQQCDPRSLSLPLVATLRLICSVGVGRGFSRFAIAQKSSRNAYIGNVEPSYGWGPASQNLMNFCAAIDRRSPLRMSIPESIGRM